jgi:hypothetical protein
LEAGRARLHGGQRVDRVAVAGFEVEFWRGQFDERRTVRNEAEANPPAQRPRRDSASLSRHDERRAVGELSLNVDPDLAVELRRATHAPILAFCPADHAQTLFAATGSPGS